MAWKPALQRHDDRWRIKTTFFPSCRPIHPSIHSYPYRLLRVHFIFTSLCSVMRRHHAPHWAELFIGPQKKKRVVHGESDHEDDAGPLVFWYIVIFPFPSYQFFLLLLFPQIFFSFVCCCCCRWKGQKTVFAPIISCIIGRVWNKLHESIILSEWSSTTDFLFSNRIEVFPLRRRLESWDLVGVLLT